MFSKNFLFILALGYSKAIFIESSTNQNKDAVNSPGWRMIKIYDPPSQAAAFKYEPYAYPKYEFEYSVSDKKTGDHKHHHEARDGDRVRGEYSLVETDGSLRKVQYHADDHNGFNAVVSKHVNKHNDHAVSITDHTRYFYPVGHNIKINHYFPGKDYHYQNNGIIDNENISKPVHEETALIKNNDEKIFLNEPLDTNIAAKPVEAGQRTKELIEETVPEPKSELIEVVPVEIVPAIPINPKTEDDINAEVNSSLPTVETSPTLSSNEPSSNDKQKDKKEDQNDSDVASSYYHSKFYYIGY